MKYYRAQSFNNRNPAPEIDQTNLELANDNPDRPRFLAEPIDSKQIEIFELTKDEDNLKKEQEKQSKIVRCERYGATAVTIFILAAIALVINFVFRIRECDQVWQEKDSNGLCKNKCANNAVYITSSNTCCECANSWQAPKNNRCVNRCTNSEQPYWENRRKLCVRCRQPSQTPKDDVLCIDKCTGSDSWNTDTQKCDGCSDFWKKKANNVCEDRCPKQNGGTFDRYNTFNKECITYYEVLNKNAQNVEFLRTRQDRLGSSLTNKMKCGNSQQEFDTPFSKKDIQFKDYIYVHIVTSENQQAAQTTYYKLQMFLPSTEYRKLQKIVATNDNVSNQCKSNPLRCYDNLKKNFEFYAIRDVYNNANVWQEHYDEQYKNQFLTGLRRWNQDEGQNRFNHELTWYTNGRPNGKSLKKKQSQVCVREYYNSNGIQQGSWTGYDMSQQFR